MDEARGHDGALFARVSSDGLPLFVHEVGQLVLEAVTPLPGHPHSYVVVTLERTTATASGAYRGLPPAWHVTLATVAPVGRGLWVLSAWQPQS